MTRLVLAVCLVWTVAPAWADPGPLIRAGEWETRISMNDRPALDGKARKICHKSDQRLTADAVRTMMSRFATTCSKHDVSTSGAVTRFDLVCQLGEARVFTQGTITLDGPDALTTTAHTHTEGGKIAVPEMTITAVSHRLGPCQPGDVPEPQ